MYDVWENGAGELDKAEKRDCTPRERNEQTREKVVCPECSGALRGNTCMSCGWERPARSDIHAVEGELRQFDPTSLGIEARPGLRAECLKHPRKVWEAALNHCALSTSKGELAGRKWAYGVWRGIYPNSKLPFGWFDMAIPLAVDPNALALIDREVRRFRKSSSSRRAA